MKLKAAFLFLAPEADPRKHFAVVQSPSVELTVVGVASYDAAVEEAQRLVKSGVAAIELCAGFGVEGTAMVKAAVHDQAAVGAVRFDFHPGLGFKSGDEIFSATAALH